MNKIIHWKQYRSEEDQWALMIDAWIDRLKDQVFRKAKYKYTIQEVEELAKGREKEEEEAWAIWEDELELEEYHLWAFTGDVLLEQYILEQIENDY